MVMNTNLRQLVDQKLRKYSGEESPKKSSRIDIKISKPDWNEESFITVECKRLSDYSPCALYSTLTVPEMITSAKVELYGISRHYPPTGAGKPACP
jgi:hypothetical protein